MVGVGAGGWRGIDGGTGGMSEKGGREERRKRQSTIDYTSLYNYFFSIYSFSTTIPHFMSPNP